jgi:uncharacterized protein involved in exopolysaccharide biosynthesis
MTAQYHDDEINLRDYLNVLIKRKVTIAAIFLVCIAAAAIYSFTAPEVYKVDATLRIGGVGKTLMSKEEAIRLIQSKRVLQPVVDKLDRDLSVQGLKESIKIEKVKDTNFINLNLNHKNPKRAIAVLGAIADNFTNRGNDIYNKQIGLLKQQIETLENRQKAIEAEMKQLTVSIQKGETRDFPLIQNTLTNYEQIYSDLTDKLFSLKKQLMEAEKFQLFEAPLMPENPISPNKKQNIAIAAVLGLMLGVFIVFFREFWVSSAGEEEK